MTIRIEPPRSPVNAEVLLPGSKSIAARALILNAIHGNRFSLSGLPDCGDTRELAGALDRLSRSKRSSGAVYDLGNGGTSFRFFLAYCASLEGFSGTVTCGNQLRNRPVKPLIDALRNAGAHIIDTGCDGLPPFRVEGHRLRSFSGGVDCAVSSQFASALIIASLLWEKPWVPGPEGESVSQPYIDMTLRMCRLFDAAASGNLIYEVERDWSAASYFHQLRALCPGSRITLPGLLPPGESLQGDSRCAELFGRIATAGGIYEEDMSDTPDLVPALAVTLALLNRPFRLHGVASLRHKESDRLQALSEESGKAGLIIKTRQDTLTFAGTVGTPSIYRKSPESPVRFDSHGDHRIAMAFAAGAPVLGPVEITGAESVAKSFPGFFTELKKCGFNISTV